MSTLVGAGSYNLLVLTSICSFCVYKFNTQLLKYQIIRDALFYSLNLVVLLTFLIRNDAKKLYWYESLSSVLIYVVFVLVNVFDSAIRGFLERVKLNWFNNSKTVITNEKNADVEEKSEMIDVRMEKERIFEVVSKKSCRFKH